MEFDSIIKKRRSVRSFRAKKVDWKLVLTAIDTAIQGPFAGNQNNLRFLIIESSDLIKKISSLTRQPWISSAPTLILVCSDDTYLEKLYGQRGQIYSRQQAGAAINTILFKLVDLGLAACWVGEYSDDILKESLKIPQHVEIEAVIAAGYHGTSPETGKRAIRKYKRPLENSVYWGKWEQDQRPSLFREPEDLDIIKSADQFKIKE